MNVNQAVWLLISTILSSSISHFSHGLHLRYRCISIDFESTITYCTAPSPSPPPPPVNYLYRLPSLYHMSTCIFFAYLSLLSIPILSATTSPQDNQQLTLDTCDGPLCTGLRTRLCTKVTDNDQTCDKASQCWCLPLGGPRYCSQHYQCVPGEACATVPDQGTICVSETYIDLTEAVTRIPGKVFHFPPNTRAGLSYDTCERPAECGFDRSCCEPDTLALCSDAAACLCIPSQHVNCSSSTQCISGEVCTNVPDVGTVCTSETFANWRSEEGLDKNDTTASSDGSSNEPSDEPSDASSSDDDDGTSNQVCIGAHHLQHLHQSSLLYDHHRLARVLCDVNSSCATPGHIVRLNGSPMMMQTYCAHAPCTHKVMKVNSPRYERRLSIESHTEGLVFTTFAARYESLVEEQFLRMLIRIRL